ncbi:hypothetical protein PRK78_003571 [Emydomyces testavorans]|uniref:Alpha/beta hydrolase fold-3 domain-containing protein n=1 Tax=Emydomyces testavorans TaxID=2070801 RepID=A0AAF0DGA1_9EURO|nr:hypothetical protein PRK78_003571 [Emydomyces testavorans]
MRLSIPLTSSFLLTPQRTWTRRCVAACRARWISHIPQPRFNEYVEHLPVRHGGNITLRILEPVTSRVTSDSRVLLYLPPGPVFAFPSSDISHPILIGNQQHAGSAHLLASASLSTIVTVHYRLGQEPHPDEQASSFKFPTPIYDTLAGFDWIFQNLRPAQIGVFGNHIGGSLALMLALTEPRSIFAVAAQDPICDWVGLDDYCMIESEKNDDVIQDKETFSIHETNGHDGSGHKKRGRKKKPQKPVPPDLLPLLKARNELFHSPRNYFDSFASPALFLRTTGKYCPTRFPAVLTGSNHPVPVIKPAKEEDLWLLTAFTLEKQEAEAESNISASPRHPVRRRRVLSRWPPVGLDYGADTFRSTGYKGDALNSVALPNVRIFIHSNLDLGETRSEQESSQPDTVDELSSQLEQMALKPNKSSHDEKLASSPEHKHCHSTPRGSLPDMSKINEETVLAAQGAEMVQLMHSACFWGREKGFGENRVKLIRVPYRDNSQSKDAMCEEKGGQNWAGYQSSGSVEEQAGEWFLRMLNEDRTTDEAG